MFWRHRSVGCQRRRHRPNEGAALPPVCLNERVKVASVPIPLSGKSLAAAKWLDVVERGRDTCAAVGREPRIPGPTCR